MEEALSKVGADVSVVSNESGETIANYKSGPDSKYDLAAAGQKFVSLDKLALNLKMGSLSQLVTVKNDEAELCTHHTDSHSVSIVAADRLDKAFAAESLVNDLLK